MKLRCRLISCIFIRLSSDHNGDIEWGKEGQHSRAGGDDGGGKTEVEELHRSVKLLNKLFLQQYEIGSDTQTNLTITTETLWLLGTYQSLLML